jgi:hypothetical protein
MEKKPCSASRTTKSNPATARSSATPAVGQVRKQPRSGSFARTRERKEGVDVLLMLFPAGHAEGVAGEKGKNTDPSLRSEPALSRRLQLEETRTDPSLRSG